jgi:lysyl-tRNA synthetase class I
LGNIVTILTAAEIAYILGNHRTDVNLTICDLDLPDAVDFPIEYDVVRHYKYIEDKDGCHKNISEHNSEKIIQFTDDILKTMSTKFIIRNLSDIQKEPGYRQGLLNILEHSQEVSDLFPGDTSPEKALIFPICKECNTAHKQQPKHADGRLYATCVNDNCEVEDYIVNVLDTSYELAVHFFIDPIRDNVVEPKADLHVFGGDYGAPHGRNKLPKAEKILRLMQLTGQTPPEIYIGPLFYAQDGKKMSKSAMTGLSFENLKEYLGEDYIKRIREFTHYILEGGFKHVDYGVVREHLLAKK